MHLIEKEICTYYNPETNTKHNDGIRINIYEVEDTDIFTNANVIASYSLDLLIDSYDYFPGECLDSKPIALLLSKEIHNKLEEATDTCIVICDDCR